MGQVGLIDRGVIVLVLLTIAVVVEIVPDIYSLLDLATASDVCTAAWDAVVLVVAILKPVMELWDLWEFVQRWSAKHWDR